MEKNVKALAPRRAGGNWVSRSKLLSQRQAAECRGTGVDRPAPAAYTVYISTNAPKGRWVMERTMTKRLGFYKLDWGFACILYVSPKSIEANSTNWWWRNGPALSKEKCRAIKGQTCKIPKKIIYFFQHCHLPKWNRVSTYWNSENCLWHEFADLQDTQTQGNHLLSSVHNAEVALTLVHLNINKMKNKKEEIKTIFVHFFRTKAEQS